MIPSCIISFHPIISSWCGRLGLMRICVVVCLLSNIRVSVVVPVICICLLFASLMSYSLLLSGFILNLCFVASSVLAADIVAPESGSDIIWFVLVPCIVVITILGVADDNSFIFPVWLIVALIPFLFCFVCRLLWSWMFGGLSGSFVCVFEK